MNKYNENSRCPKCDNRHISTKFRDMHGCHSIVRRCARCGYEWQESPLDRDQ